MSSGKRKTKHGYAATPAIQPMPSASEPGETEGVVDTEDMAGDAPVSGVDYVPLSEAIARGVMRGDITKEALERYLAAVEEDRALAEERAAVAASRFTKLSAAMVGLGLIIAGSNLVSLFRDPPMPPEIVQPPPVAEAKPAPALPAAPSVSPAAAPAIPPPALPVAPPPTPWAPPETVLTAPPEEEPVNPPPAPAPKRRALPRVSEPSLARAVAVRNRPMASSLVPGPEVDEERWIPERW
jgi:hypothetical protein